MHRARRHLGIPHLGICRQAMRPSLWLLALVVALSGTMIKGTPARAESNEATAIRAAFGIEYAVPNGPRNLAEEAPGRIWYTSTDAGGIGFLEVISPTVSSPGGPVIRYRTDFYGLGAASRPYDLVYHNGAVWFTLNGLRSLGRIDVVTREIKTFPLLSFGALPTGIDVAPDGRLWIAQNNGRISRFDPVTEEFTEFLMPDALRQAPRIEDIVYQNERAIWFTMPDANLVVAYDSVRDRFFETPTAELQPSGINISPDGSLWVTAYGTSKVGVYVPTTISIWLWYNTLTAEGGPLGVLVFNDADGVRQVWFTEHKTGNIGRLQLANGFTEVNREKIGPNDPAGSTAGIIRTADEHIWVADSGRNVLYELRAPYINRIYIASIINDVPNDGNNDGNNDGGNDEGNNEDEDDEDE